MSSVGWHLSFTKVAHKLSPLGSPDDNYLMSIAKVQCSSIVFCTDPYLHRLYLYDLSRPYNRLTNEIEGYHRNDLAISSIALRDDEDGNCVCGDLCTDNSGYRIYALMLSRDGRGAWVKVYQHLNRKLSFTGLRYKVPSLGTTLISANPDWDSIVRDIQEGGHIGIPSLYNQLCYGSGIEILDGDIYILTRRRINTIMGRPLQVSFLTKLNANTGQYLGHYYLSLPGTETDFSKDAVFHGLTRVDNKLVSQIRYDHRIMPNDVLYTKQTRGQSAVVIFDKPEDNLNPKALPYPVLPYEVIHNVFPYGIAMAYSITTDNSERKYYGVFGNQIWVFDVLDYTIIVRHPDSESATGWTYFEGDIIDMGNILIRERSQLQCFFKNNSPYTMYDVELIIEAGEEGGRWEDLFVSLTQEGTGYKDLIIGDVVPGGSKEFWTEVHPQTMNFWEDMTTHAIPLRIKYTTKQDEF